MKSIISLNKRWLITILVFSSLLVAYQVSANTISAGDEVTLINDDCTGCGMCDYCAPDIFEIGDDGKAYVKRQPTNSNERNEVILAQVQCPSGCIFTNF